MQNMGETLGTTSDRRGAPPGYAGRPWNTLSPAEKNLYWYASEAGFNPAVPPENSGISAEVWQTYNAEQKSEAYKKVTGAFNSAKPWPSEDGYDRNGNKK
jgi:hypothetical protein